MCPPVAEFGDSEAMSVTCVVSPPGASTCSSKVDMVTSRLHTSVDLWIRLSEFRWEDWQSLDVSENHATELMVDTATPNAHEHTGIVRRGTP